MTSSVWKRARVSRFANIVDVARISITIDVVSAADRNASLSLAREKPP